MGRSLGNIERITLMKKLKRAWIIIKMWLGFWPRCEKCKEPAMVKVATSVTRFENLCEHHTDLTLFSIKIKKGIEDALQAGLKEFAGWPIRPLTIQRIEKRACELIIQFINEMGIRHTIEPAIYARQHPEDRTRIELVFGNESEFSKGITIWAEPEGEA